MHSGRDNRAGGTQGRSKEGLEVDSSTGLDDAFVDADVEAIQALAAQPVDSELELSETGRVRSDFVNDSRYKPY